MSVDDMLLWYARKGPVRAARASCYRKFCRRNRGREGITTTRYGATMKLVLGDSVENRIFVEGVFERGLSEQIYRLAQDHACFVDVGCNIGYFACLFAKTHPDAQVYAIDANPRMVDRTRENLRLNDARHAEVFHYGVSSGRGTLDFHVPRRRHSLGSFAGSGRHAHDCDVIKVDIRPLMEIIPAEGIRRAVLKIDVEGHEHHVLSGLSEADALRFDVMFLEFASEHLRRAGVSESALFEFPWLRHFEVFLVLSDGGLKPFTYETGQDYSCTLCFLRRPDKAS